MRNERLLDAVEDVIGPNSLCWDTIFWIKKAHTPSYVGWHQDLKYWGRYNGELVSVWLALSPANETSGRMSVLPGSHTELLERRETYDDDNMLARGQELTIDIEGREVVSMPLEPVRLHFTTSEQRTALGPIDRRIAA